MRGNLFAKEVPPHPFKKTFAQKRKKEILYYTNQKLKSCKGDYRSLVFCISSMYFLTISRKYCIIKERKRVLLQYGIFLSHFFICISACGFADLLCYTAKREEFSPFSRQPSLLRVGRTRIRNPNAFIHHSCVPFWLVHLRVSKRKTALRKGFNRSFGMR